MHFGQELERRTDDGTGERWEETDPARRKGLMIGK